LDQLGAGAAEQFHQSDVAEIPGVAGVADVDIVLDIVKTVAAVDDWH
jgi:hypothetical protein